MVERVMHPQYLIRKGGYYYRPRARGYTSDPKAAGLFTRQQAIAYSYPNGPDGPRDGISFVHQSEVLQRPGLLARIFGRV